MSCSTTEPTGSHTQPLPDESDDEIPPLPVEILALAGDLMALGETENMQWVTTLGKAEQLGLAFWTKWWEQNNANAIDSDG